MVSEKLFTHSFSIFGATSHSKVAEDNPDDQVSFSVSTIKCNTKEKRPLSMGENGP
jgi:hypothetical protein